MSYEVYMLDNFTFGDFDHNYTLGIYDTYEEALKAAQTIVDHYLLERYELGMSAKELYKEFMVHGESPLIVGSAMGTKPGSKTTVSGYIQSRATQICATAISAGIEKEAA